MSEHRNANKSMFFLLLHLIFISKLIIFLLIKVLPFLKDAKSAGIFQILGSLIFFLIPFAFYKIRARAKTSEILMFEKISLKNIFIIISLALLFQPFLQLIANITNLFFENKIENSINIMLNLPFWQLILSVAVFPAITEEIIFRGVILKEYENSHFLLGVIFSGIFFGIMHLTLTQLFYATVAGIIIALIVKITRSIWAGILFHFILNASQATLGYIIILINSDKEGFGTLDYEQMDMAMKVSGILGSVFLFLASLPFLLIGIKIFQIINKENISRLKNESLGRPLSFRKEIFFDKFFILTILIYIFYIIFQGSSI